MIYPRAEALNYACYFMSRNNRVTNEGKFAIPNHQVSVAHSACVDFDEHLTIAGRWHGTIFNVKPALGFFQDRRPHGQGTSLSINASLSVDDSVRKRLPSGTSLFA